MTFAGESRSGLPICALAVPIDLTPTQTPEETQ